jgi:hypothetical protein
MTKKWLMYVVTGLLCCGLLAFATTQKQSRAAQLKASANAVDKLIREHGQTQELLDKKASVEAAAQSQGGMPAAVKPAKDAPATGVQTKKTEDVQNQSVQRSVGRVATEEERLLISGRPLNGVTPRTLEEERASLLQAIESLQAEGRDYSAQKARYNEIAAELNDRNPGNPLDQGGETCAEAPAITALPYCDQGTTVGAVDNYDGFSPEVVYSYTPTVTENIKISLCGNSNYDTRLIVYSGACPDAGGTLIFNNDDWCGLQSCSEAFGTLTVTAGTIYYILVDGFSGNVGQYTLKVEVDNGQACNADPFCAGAVGRCCYGQDLLTCDDITSAECDALGGIWDGFASCEANPCPNCAVSCGPFDIAEEDESDTCALEASDPNGGCNNLNGPLWLDIACEDTVCGDAFTYINCTNGGQYRDTDWIRFTTTTPSIISWSAVARFDGLQLFVMDGGYCTNFILYGSLFIPTCGEVGTITTECLPPGDYIVWAGTGFFTGLPYGSPNTTYRGWVDCTPCVIPTGRCCYYDESNLPACATNYEGECFNLGGFWTEGLNCVDDPCVVGRCCYNNGVACGDFFDVHCAQLGGLFDEFTSCQTEPCENICALDCDPLDIVEPDDQPGYCESFGANDLDGGCNVDPPTYIDVACGDWICAQTFTCDAIGYRDTDWFRFTITEAQDVTITAEAEFSDLLFGIVDISDCGFAFFVANAFIFDCSVGQASVTAFCLPAGTYAAWGGSANGFGLPNPVQYRMQITCAPATNCPVGRCCYNDGLACEDNTSPECDALGGIWEQFNSCANPCPVPVDNDDCETAEVIVTVNNGSVTTASGAEGATETCDAQPCADDCPFFPVSSGIDQFYTFTLTECRLLAIEADHEVFFTDPHIAVYNDGECCGAAIACNDDWGCNAELDFIPWLPPFLRPVAGFGSMIADSFGPGTYYIRAGHYGAGWNGNYDLTIWDFGPCVVAPCDPVTDLTILVETPGNLPTNVKLFWTAPQDDEFKVWSTTNPLNDGNPDDGADADWTLEHTTGLLSAGPQSWAAPAGFFGVGAVGAPKFYVVTAVCEPFQAPIGRCCYGEFQCADVTEEECNGLGGSWTQFMSCTANPCPPPPPANDECGDAIEVFNATPLAGSNIDATGADITSCTFDDIFDVWYVFNAANTNLITVSVCSSYDFDTGLSAWSECGGTELACIDDFCGLGSEISFVPPAAGPVYIRVAGYNSQMGNFQLIVTQ